MSPRRGKQEGLHASASNFLPPHAQNIFNKAHDSAIEEYKDTSKQRGDESLEETANKVAWSAVKQEYHKERKGEWVKK